MDIDSDLIQFEEPLREGLIKETHEYIDRSAKWMRAEDEKMVFSKGQCIRHAIFGDGEVLEVDLVDKRYLIKFDDVNTPRSISFKAKLEKVDETL